MYRGLSLLGSADISIPPHESILVVDDDRGFQLFLEALLERAGFAVRVASDGEEALAAADESLPALTLLDVVLPRMSGYELCRQLRDRFGDGLPIMFISGERRQSFDRVSGLLVGADDYLAKPFDPDELLARVRALLRRGRARDERLAAPEGGRAFHELTARELQVLWLLADGSTQDEIATLLVISPRTVGTHIQNILGKLEVHSRAQAVSAAHRRGLARPEDLPVML
jgi:DNA-binding response OmpR family regulator